MQTQSQLICRSVLSPRSQQEHSIILSPYEQYSYSVNIIQPRKVG